MSLRWLNLQFRAVIGMPYSCRDTVRLKTAVFHRFDHHAPAPFRRIPESTTTFDSLIGGEIRCGCCTGPRSTGRTERICTANRFLVLSKIDSSSGNHLRAVGCAEGRRSRRGHRLSRNVRNETFRTVFGAFYGTKRVASAIGTIEQ